MTWGIVVSNADNPFEVLGVDADSDTEEIRLAYRAAARRHHPDRGGDPAVFRAVSAAYRSLRTAPGRNAMRDRWGMSGENGPPTERIPTVRARRAGPIPVGLVAGVSALFAFSLLVLWAVGGPLVFLVVLLASGAVGVIAGALRHLIDEAPGPGQVP